MKFKKGDRCARVLGGDLGGEYLNDFYIQKIEGDKVFFKSNVVSNMGCPSWFHKDYLNEKDVMIIKPLIDGREQAIYKRLCGIKRPKPKTVKFKKGDLVECVGTSGGGEGDKTYGGAGWEAGLRFKVNNVSPHGNQDICWGNMRGGVYAHHLKLVDGRGR